MTDAPAEAATWTHEVRAVYEQVGYDAVAATAVDAARRLAGLEHVQAELDGDIGEASEPAPGSTWAERDLTQTVLGILAGTIERPAPTIGKRDDGAAIFYEGRVNGLFGPSGSGKSMVAMFVAVQEINAGRHAVFVDLEDDEIGAVGRALDLGAAPDAIVARFHYHQPDEPYSVFAEPILTGLVDRVRPTVVVIDSTGEAMALDGRDPDKDPEVAAWYRRFPTAIARMGPAVVLLDHVTKAGGGADLHAIGSQRKRAAITGAQYLVTTIREFAIGRAGAAKLTVAKDRCGNYVRGTKVADFTVSDEMVAFLLAPSTTSEFRPTEFMRRIGRYVELHPEGVSTRDIRGAVVGKNDAKDMALSLLVSEGYVAREQHGKGYLHTPVKRFYDDEEGTSE